MPNRERCLSHAAAQQITAAPEEVRDQLRNLTAKRLRRTCAAWRPDRLAFLDPATVTKIATTASEHRSAGGLLACNLDTLAARAVQTA